MSFNQRFNEHHPEFIERLINKILRFDSQRDTPMHVFKIKLFEQGD